ncbi:helicase-exonuclease AddAB subunit AddA [Lachnoclostridium phytofermentans]|uniref:ATP-dependent helicase/nuclease subunit A n=1 Tax=Lachnoclostridium phytofermentans (strain ATCC 700394 / DSM 18823 / ISDg) TaxID=357809 RepID=ADDA_LACP7|nr:helicase-exonuclease AddAB subunit AddA [Lachnoclostridium phytofermentans]A9KTE6.1 RecName: Full=ATP-dependent helicase/nuclease subunit A; AltName: Full=ATP-dependent helicase/nuclease AddA; AltName: Full=DNA 3'-5' helicase AddA [Lachnoclostridium phytofermentans ISDg]ABX43776.1 recombination helicase AddA [Lachnoclostridium phytofermentans ISDg]
MAKTSWTPGQQKVIDTRDCNLLVSAAAGSGKTAVLVERIINRITSENSPINIDQLLIVTFTKAAAGEMRERIGAAIEKKVLEQPDNVHLQKQLTLLYSAQITTIDSFCLSVIRNHFHTIDLDPSFRIAEEAELMLLKSDVLATLLEEKYEEGAEDFLEFVECYSASKSDEPIENFILKLYQFSQSYPYPHEWLEEREKDFLVETAEDINQTSWMKQLLQYVKAILREASDLCAKAIEITNYPDGPKPYLDALLSDQEIIERLLNSDAGSQHSYEEYQDAFSNITFARLSTKKWPDATEERKEEVKAIRQMVKKILSDLSDDFFFQPMEDMLTDMRKVRRPMLVLLSLTHDFLERLDASKEENNLVDFSDIEHFALNILVTKEDGNLVPTKVATEMSEQFVEIMIDEYQDSNYVQEYILSSISKVTRGCPNVFMVGDVKQSIYKFRMARPELFMEKYEQYSTEEGLYRRIDLSKNFRSRAEVLDSINGVFEKIMTKAMGGIEYTKEVSLYPGAQFPEIGMDLDNTSFLFSDTKTELIILDLKEEEASIPDSMDRLDVMALEEDAIELSKRELEAKAVAMRIKQLVHGERGFSVTKRNGEEQDLKRCQYRDIVILLRTMSGWSETFTEILKQEGIPAYSDTQTGYFQTLEVKTVLNYLRILDNPRQDAPLTAILYSPIVGLSAEQLSFLRVKPGKGAEKLSIYDAARECALNYLEIQDEVTQPEETQPVYDSIIQADLMYEKSSAEKTVSMDKNLIETGEKLKRFFATYDKLREKAIYLPVHEIILEFFKETGYDLFVYAMPGGEQRRNNLNLLVQHALSFEESSYHGLFQFIRYIERLLKFEIDYGEAGGLSENDNAVRIMSIHKSKGLEFPVVILAGMGKQFNTMDAREKIVLHADYGIGPECIDYQLRTKCPTLLKQVIKKNIVLDNLGEELRVLYVALTRAKEKLIMIGSANDANDVFDKWRQDSTPGVTPLRFQTLAMAKDYFSFVGPAALYDSRIRVITLTPNDLLEDEYEKQTDIKNKQEELNPYNFLQSFEEESDEQSDEERSDEERSDGEQSDGEQSDGEQPRKDLLTKLSFRYPYEHEAMLPIKTTVSELKKLSQQVDEELTETFTQVKDELTKTWPQVDEELTEKYPQVEELIETSPPVKEESQMLIEPTIPKFLKEEKELRGTERGNLYHKILELIDFSDNKTKLNLREFVSQLANRGLIQEESISSINFERLSRFFESELYQRIQIAYQKGYLYREQPFVIGIPVREISTQKFVRTTQAQASSILSKNEDFSHANLCSCPNSQDYENDDLVLIQGIIDVYFEEEDGIVLVDYKTDAVGELGEEELIRRYQEQIRYYERALNQLLDKTVKEKIIYSFSLGKEIRIKS